MLRPQKWEEFVGQEKIIKNLKMYLEAAMILEKPLDHILISGNSGMGKTSLAYLIGVVMKVKVHFLNGPSLQKPSDIISVLTTIKENEVVFLDEVHAISREVMEILYPAIEEFKINIIIGKEYNSKNINIKLPKFTLLVATTEIDKLPLPFINRFPISFVLEDYTKEEMGRIIFNYAKELKLPLSPEAAIFLGEFSRGVPRIALNLVKRLNDFYQTKMIKNLDDFKEIKQVLEQMGIYDEGLSKNDLDYLNLLSEHEVIGLENMAQMLNQPTRMLIVVVEPLLLKKGFILRTSKGRAITPKGRVFLQQKSN